MASRLWHPSSGAAPISPAFDASWAITAAATRGQLTGVPMGTAGSSSPSVTRTASQAAGTALARQDVSPALPGAKTISGTATVAMPHRFSGDVSGINATPRIVIRVVTPAGATRGTLLTATGTPSSGYANYKPAIITGALTPVNALAGDYVVIERGWSFPNNVASATTASLYIGDPFDKPDTVAGDSSPAFDFRPWSEFSQDDIWGPIPRRVAGLATEVLDRATNPPRRVAGLAVEVLDRASAPSIRVAAMALEVLRARAGQQRIRHLRQRLTDTEPLIKTPAGSWRAIRPLPLPAALPKPPQPLYITHGEGVTSFANLTAGTPLKAGDTLILAYVAGRSTGPRKITSAPTVIAGVTWQQIHDSGTLPGTDGPKSAAWLGTVTADTVLPGSVGVSLEFSDTACSTTLAAYRYLEGTVVAVVGSADNTTAQPYVLAPGVELTRDRIAVVGCPSAVSSVLTPTNAPAWIAETYGTGKSALASDPLDAAGGNLSISITANAGLNLSGIVVVVE